MEIPLILKTALWAQMLPPLALLSRRNLSRPVLFIAAGAAISVIGNFVAVYVANRTGNNHFVALIFGGLMTIPYLLGLAEWQVTFFERLTLRLFIVPFVLTYVALTVFAEGTTTFSRFTGPLSVLVILGASAWTLLRRAFQTSTPITRTDWFWVAGGLALYGATTALAQPIGAILLADDRLDLFDLVWQFRAVCVDLSFLSIVAGFLIHPDATHA